MASLLSDSDKNNLSSVISGSMFDTFKSSITIWKKPELTIISSDPNFNYLMGDYDKTTVENVPISQSFDAIILYMKPQEIRAFLEGQGRLDERINEDKVMVRIKCKEDCFNYIKDSVMIEFDGKKFKLSSGAKQYGLFNRDLYMFILEEVK